MLSREEALATRQECHDILNSLDVEILDLMRKSERMQSEGIYQHASEVSDVMQRRSSVHDVLSEVNDAIYQEKFRFVRPRASVAGFVSTALGALPPNMPVMHATADNLQQVKRYRLLGPMILGLVFSIIIFLLKVFPALSWSPYRAMRDILAGTVGVWPGTILSIIGLIVAIRLLSSGVGSDSTQGGFIARAALYEEQWFRAGSEDWTHAQRAYSCVAFGAIHFINVFYPIVTLIALSVAGACFMAVYLKEYRRSQSTELATLASTQVHASYNRAAFVVFFIAVTIAFIVDIFM